MKITDIIRTLYRISVTVLVLLILVFVFAPLLIPNPSGLHSRQPIPPVPSWRAWQAAIAEALAANDIDVLGAILTSHIVVARHDAAYALRQAKPTKQTLSWLAFALNSPDRKVQYDAMMGIGEAANKLGLDYRDLPKCPAVVYFEQDPELYLNAWRLWWNTNHSMLLAKIHDD